MPSGCQTGAMAMSDPFLPHESSRARRDLPLQPEDHDGDDEREPDVLSGPGDAEAVDEPPVHEGGVFRTPTGARVDPADDV
jgi:hypothetical protein